MSKPTLANWLALITLGVIWGGSFMGAKIALIDLEPMTVALLRLAIAAVVLWLVTLATGRKFPGFSTPTDRRIWGHIALMGLITNAIPFTLLNWGQLYVSSGFAGVTMAVVPLLVLPLSHFFLKGGQMTLRKTVGFGFGFIGIVILIGPAKLLAATGSNLEPIARVACIAAACCYALGTINTRLCPPVSVMAYSAGGLIIGTIALLPVTLMFEGIPSWPDAPALMGVVFLGLFPTALATILLVSVVNTAGPSFMSLVNYQVPLWAVLFGVLFLDESLPPSFIGAFALILFGLAISQSRAKTGKTFPAGKV
ncbi:ABC transporter permease [Amylibacter marinus]|uniref:ABC transporter permease n=1 Tax=Amylibacter marinus TaxID=1475483 RepID=A0ABQ5VTB7_9RHOB|nr:EamA family transporter [Amylibacter marinus]GLQ34569.1 ABC transporter permease [Amylibacter marinus]